MHRFERYGKCRYIYHWLEADQDEKDDAENNDDTEKTEKTEEKVENKEVPTKTPDSECEDSKDSE